MCSKTKRIDDQLRWLSWSRIAIDMLEVVPKKDIDKNFNDIRAMKRHELRNYIYNHQTACNKVKSRRYTPDDAFIASKVVYAQNRLILI